MKLGIVFAGQGSQKAGMGKDFYEASEDFRQVFDLLPEEQKIAAFEGPQEVLSDTRVTQPVMVAFATGVMNELTKRGIRPEMAAGLSLGEYSALYSAGVFDEKTVIELVTLRAEEMHKAAENIDCGMCAVLGLPKDVLKQCCDEASSLGVVSMVNFNCPGQIVISGEKNAVEKCAELALEKGAKRCMNLPVSGPFHTEFMKPAGKALEEKFKETEFKEMKFPVVFNAIGRAKHEEESVQELLVKQVSSSVHFEDSIRYMESQGIDTIIEIGPGKTLSSFIRKTSKGIRVLNIETVEDLEKAVILLEGEKDGK